MDPRAPHTLTAHQPPALLIAAVEVAHAGGGMVTVLPHHGLDAWQLIEAGAQAVAVLSGARAQAAGGGPAAGMLVGAKGFVVARTARGGEAVRIEAREVHRMGGMSLHAVRASVGAEELARGELTIAVPTAESKAEAKSGPSAASGGPAGGAAGAAP